MNVAMRDGLEAGEIIDVSWCNRLDDGSYLLPAFVDGLDYCVATKEQWIQSIGKHKLSGRYVASTDTRFHQNPNYDCVFLR